MVKQIIFGKTDIPQLSPKTLSACFSSGGNELELDDFLVTMETPTNARVELSEKSGASLTMRGHSLIGIFEIS